jgi:hypothetical protein
MVPDPCGIFPLTSGAAVSTGEYRQSLDAYFVSGTGAGKQSYSREKIICPSAVAARRDPRTLHDRRRTVATIDHRPANLAWAHHRRSDIFMDDMPRYGRDFCRMGENGVAAQTLL